MLQKWRFGSSLQNQRSMLQKWRFDKGTSNQLLNGTLNGWKMTVKAIVKAERLKQFANGTLNGWKMTVKVIVKAERLKQFANGTLNGWKMTVKAIVKAECSKNEGLIEERPINCKWNAKWTLNIWKNDNQNATLDGLVKERPINCKSRMIKIWDRFEFVLNRLLLT